MPVKNVARKTLRERAASDCKYLPMLIRERVIRGWLRGYRAAKRDQKKKGRGK